MDKKKKIVFLVNIVFFSLIIIADTLFICNTIDTKIIKPIASALFVLCGLFNLLYIHKYHKTNQLFKSIVLFLGLILAFVGDVVLMFDFIAGAVCFAIGHLFFLAYFVLTSPVKWIDLLISGIIISACMILIYLYKGFDFQGLDFVITIYAVIISLMLGKAIGNFAGKNSLGNLILMLGAILFFISDVMLVFDNFANISQVFDTLCLATYYPGEFLLSFGLLVNGVAIKNDNKVEVKEDKKDSEEK